MIFIAGFNGGGMTTIFEAARGMARIVVDGLRLKEIGIPKIFFVNE